MRCKRRLLKEAGCSEPKFDFGNFYTITFPRRWEEKKRATTKKLAGNYKKGLLLRIGPDRGGRRQVRHPEAGA